MPRDEPATKDKDGDHSDVVQEHGGDQSFRSTARRVLPRDPARNAKSNQRYAGYANGRDAGGGRTDEPSSRSTTTEGAASSTNPVAASSAPVTERSGLRLTAMLPRISAPLINARKR